MPPLPDVFFCIPDRSTTALDTTVNEGAEFLRRVQSAGGSLVEDQAVIVEEDLWEIVTHMPDGVI